ARPSHPAPPTRRHRQADGDRVRPALYVAPDGVGGAALAHPVAQAPGPTGCRARGVTPVGRGAAPHRSDCGRLRDGHDVRRLGALLALAAFELDLGTLGERLEAVAGDRRVMDEQILRSVVRRDEAVALRVVEPL